MCILITLYHIKTHSRNRTCHLVQQGYTNKSMAIDLSMFLYDNLCKDYCLMHIIRCNCCAPNQSHPVYMFESCITQPNLPNQSVSDDYHIETHWRELPSRQTSLLCQYNMLQYSVTLLTTFIGGGRALSDYHRQALFLVATIVKHTTELCWTYLSAKTCAMCFNIIDWLLSFWPPIKAPILIGGLRIHPYRVTPQTL